jgi:hypothetical protein
MRVPFHTLWRRAACAIRHLAVLLALAGQICGGALPARADTQGDQRAALESAMVFCQSGHKGSTEAPPPPRHYFTGMAILRGAAQAVQAGAGPAEAPLPPPPSLAWIGAAYAVPQARAPPARQIVFFYSRGPPRLI